MKNLLLSICLCICVVGRVDAGLIQWDAFKTGDGLAVKDEETGLIWLDLSVTAGQNFFEIENQYIGWALPDYTQVESLIESALPNIVASGDLGIEKQFEQRCDNSTDCFLNASMWQKLFGYVSGVRSYQTHSYGFYTDENDILRMAGTYKNGSGSANRYGAEFNEDYNVRFDRKYLAGDYQLYGTYLIKEQPMVQKRIAISYQTKDLLVQVNSPSSFIIYSLGMLLLVGRTMRIKQS